jgi:hypothetical protein
MCLPKEAAQGAMNQNCGSRAIGNTKIWGIEARNEPRARVSGCHATRFNRNVRNPSDQVFGSAAASCSGLTTSL